MLQVEAGLLEETVAAKAAAAQAVQSGMEKRTIQPVAAVVVVPAAVDMPVHPSVAEALAETEVAPEEAAVPIMLKVQAFQVMEHRHSVADRVVLEDVVQVMAAVDPVITIQIAVQINGIRREEAAVLPEVAVKAVVPRNRLLLPIAAERLIRFPLTR